MVDVGLSERELIMGFGVEDFASCVWGIVGSVFGKKFKSWSTSVINVSKRFWSVMISLFVCVILDGDMSVTAEFGGGLGGGWTVFWAGGGEGFEVGDGVGRCF